jgi:hypothetical protein
MESIKRRTQFFDEFEKYANRQQKSGGGPASSCRPPALRRYKI